MNYLVQLRNNVVLRSKIDVVFSFTQEIFIFLFDVLDKSLQIQRKFKTLEIKTWIQL